MDSTFETFFDAVTGFFAGMDEARLARQTVERNQATVGLPGLGIHFSLVGHQLTLGYKLTTKLMDQQIDVTAELTSPNVLHKAVVWSLSYWFLRRFEQIIINLFEQAKLEAVTSTLPRADTNSPHGARVTHTRDAGGMHSLDCLLHEDDIEFLWTYQSSATTIEMDSYRLPYARMSMSQMILWLNATVGSLVRTHIQTKRMAVKAASFFGKPFP